MRVEEIERTAAFWSPNGECGWSRDQVPSVVAILREHSLAILGGELWWVLDDARTWNGMIPQREGPDTAYSWETARHATESWSAFVNRCADHTLATVKELPRPGEVRSDLPGTILYNLTWVGEGEFGKLGRGAV